jgi:hypothetical protein
MQHFKVLRSIALLLVFAMAIFSCATSKNQVTNADFGMTAESVSEGILLTFKNIPSDAIRMTIHFTYFDTEEDISPHSIISSFADLRDTSFTTGSFSSIQLERVKQTGKVIFPIVQTGQEYTVFAYVYTQHDHELMLNNAGNFQPIMAQTVIIPQNGTFFNKDDIRLVLNNTISNMTLSSEPVFSSAVTFGSQKYSFGVTVIVPEIGSIGVADHHIPQGLSSDGLTWLFEPEMTRNLRENNNGWLEKGTSYSAWASAYANIIFDYILWNVQIARTHEFNYSL